MCDVSAGALFAKKDLFSIAGMFEYEIHEFARRDQR